MNLVHGSGFASSSGQSGFWTARNPSYRRSATFCVHEATLRCARTRRFCACRSFRSARRRRWRWARSEVRSIGMPGASLPFQNIVYICPSASPCSLMLPLTIGAASRRLLAGSGRTGAFTKYPRCRSVVLRRATKQSWWRFVPRCWLLCDVSDLSVMVIL